MDELSQLLQKLKPTQTNFSPLESAQWHTNQDGKISRKAFKERLGCIAKEHPEWLESIQVTGNRCRKLREVFHKIDLDQSGSIDMAELKSFGLNKRKSREQWRDWSDEQCDKIMDASDKDKNGMIDEEEFVDHWLKAMVESRMDAADTIVATTVSPSSEPGTPNPVQKVVAEPNPEEQEEVEEGQSCENSQPGLFNLMNAAIGPAVVAVLVLGVRRYVRS